MTQRNNLQPSGGKRAALRAAFPATIPVLTGYGCLGLAYGLLMSSIGYGPLWALAMSAVVYGGSIEYAAIPLLTSAFSPVQSFLLAVMVNARHIFYGLSLLGKYQGMGKARPYLIFSLTDETFSLISTLEPPPGVDRKDFYVCISLLDHSYWTIGSFLGAVVGSLLTFDTTGLDFVLTALFVVLFLEQWKKKENRAAGVIGILCMAVSVAVFGGSGPVIPAMALILLVLLGGRKQLCA
jgi:4-azaleucine resistance transporter AzlC